MYYETTLWTQSYLSPRLGWFPNQEEILLSRRWR